MPRVEVEEDGGVRHQWRGKVGEKIIEPDNQSYKKLIPTCSDARYSPWLLVFDL